MKHVEGNVVLKVLASGTTTRSSQGLARVVQMQLKSQMYTSNSNNGNDPISYCDQPFFQRPLFNDINNPNSNSNSKHEDPSLLSFLNFPSPFEDDYVFFPHNHDMLFQFQHQSCLLRPDNNTITETTVPNSINMVDSNKNHINMAEQIPRKRSCKRDRHSKINTARGPRDRRMRLSLKVAPEFFGLQELLGYDTASRTVEWLLLKSKDEIKKLEREKKRSSTSTSTVGGSKSANSSASDECEVVSGIDDVAVNCDGDQQGSVSQEKPLTKEKKIRHSQSRKSAFHPLARESREKARARARERTKAKLMRSQVDDSKLCEEASRLGSWSPFETGEESGTQSQNMNPSSLDLEVLPEAEEGSSTHARDHSGAVEDMVNSEDYLVLLAMHSTGIPQEVCFKTQVSSILQRCSDI